MSERSDLTLVCLIKVDPENLPADVTVSRLPALLEQATLAAVKRGLDPANFYLVSGDYRDTSAYVNELAVPYHQYSVSVLGDHCELSGCVDHQGRGKVLQFPTPAVR